eukprot:TRINITY_DN22039_c0_g1_i1.p1 TRINITY_DN22039_c0_g1~~TRINITY_DN22039_c0_g1_i1.p1  ORF type:complete len:517 (-),score=105.33 TRINITY_DN22039_c0_g1_i1:155-1678(-)
MNEKDKGDGSIVTTFVCWVPRGASKPLPIKYEPTQKEMEELLEQLTISDNVGIESDDDEGESKEANMEGINEEEMKAIGEKYNFDDYDDEVGGAQVLTDELKKYSTFTEEEAQAVIKEGIDPEEIDDFTIRNTDMLILTATTEGGEYSRIDVHTFEEEEDNIFVHHEIPLASYPLCMEWINYPCVPTNLEDKKGSYVAVGQMGLGIELWDLDIVDAITPARVLGGTKVQKRNRRRKPKLTIVEGSHTKSVLGLSWNKNVQNLLASSSADHTVKVWDLKTGACMQTYTHHTGIVQAVRWHTNEANVLASGSADSTVAVIDARNPASKFTWEVGSDVECIEWDPHNPSNFYVCTEEGRLMCNSVKMPGKNIFNIKAHEKVASSVSVNFAMPHIVATASFDKSVKLWDTSNSAAPVCVATRVSGEGKLFCASFCGADSPFLLAYGGFEKLSLWDITSAITPNSETASGDIKRDGNNQEFRAGDWMCPSCNNHNFASRDKCRMCSARKPKT